MGGPSPGYRWAGRRGVWRFGSPGRCSVCASVYASLRTWVVPNAEAPSPTQRSWMRAVLALLAAAAWAVPRREHAEARAVQRRRARRRAAWGRAVRRAPVHGAHAGWQSGERLRARARGRRTVEGPEAVGVSREAFFDCSTGRVAGHRREDAET